MKLAEALQERADLNRKVAQLRSRLCSNALVQDGEKPSENPEQLKRELDKTLERLEELIRRINFTNCSTKAGDVTLMELIAKKDMLVLKQAAYSDFLAEASQSTDRARGAEIKIRPAVDVAALQKEVDGIGRDIRLADNKLQETAWTTELI